MCLYELHGRHSMICTYKNLTMVQPKYWPFNRKLMVIAYLWHIESNSAPILLYFSFTEPERNLSYGKVNSATALTRRKKKRTKRKRTHIHWSRRMKKVYFICGLRIEIFSKKVSIIMQWVRVSFQFDKKTSHFILTTHLLHRHIQTHTYSMHSILSLNVRKRRKKK